nr:(2E,6Z)-farnesyl diphosphate synthase [Kibdelosporangium sp. MJ126-NF4]CTQ89819.1 (2E,6Z)-farnesyl diphosphate synthase (EC 2.5.1.68) [Kibdelosporangium sp. MJ126-NF4]
MSPVLNNTDTATAYRRGGDRVHDLLSWCDQAGIEVVTLWPLSTDNLRRDPHDVSALITVIADVIDELADAGRWRLRLLGDLTRLPPSVRQRTIRAQQRTESVQGILTNIAVAYDGHDDITTAVRALLTEHAAQGPPVATIAKTITSSLIAAHLSTAGQPEVDLIIRTSGEQRQARPQQTRDSTGSSSTTFPTAPPRTRHRQPRPTEQPRAAIHERAEQHRPTSREPRLHAADDPSTASMSVQRRRPHQQQVTEPRPTNRAARTPAVGESRDRLPPTKPVLPRHPPPVDMQHRKEDTPHAAEVSPGPHTWERTRFVDHGHTLFCR